MTITMPGRTVYVHELVLRVFVGPRPAGLQGCHNDGDKLNNSLTNLRWDTRESNALDKRTHGTTPAGERNSKAKLTRRIVRHILQYKGSGPGVARVLALQYGVSRGIIHKIWRGELWRTI
jgi:hypothetical protein